MKIKIIGAIILALALGLAWVFFSWKLTVVIFLALWGNNVEMSKLKKPN